ncbi:hypothetical protein [Microbacterium sp.]|uniref:hypothetical protein n=1 Tax=Microbacterium sp. TaxID=51671 RepID=UPI003A8B58E9
MHRSLRAATLALAAAALLSACAPQAGSGTDPEPTEAAVEPSDAPQTALPDAVESDLPLPGCDLVAPDDSAQTVLGAIAEPGEGLYLTAFADDLAGRFPESLEQTACEWQIPNSDGGYSVVLSRASADDVPTILATLREDARLTESEFAGSTVFAGEQEDGLGSTALTFAVKGTLWAAVTGTLTPDGALYAVTEALDSVG